MMKKLVCKSLAYLLLMYPTGMMAQSSSQNSLEDSADHRESPEKPVQDAIHVYLEGIKVVADQMSEDADSQHSAARRARDKAESVKLYTAYTNAYTAYARVLNRFYSAVLADPFSKPEFSLEDEMSRAVTSGEIIQDLSGIKIPEMFRHYIEARKEFLEETVS